MYNSISKLSWFSFLLSELDYLLSFLSILCDDNLGITYLIVNSVFHSRIKYVKINFYFVSYMIAKRNYKLNL